MGTVKHLLIVTGVWLVLGSCAYRYYLGLHGPSIRHFPDVHAGVTEDAQCLACHDPNGDPGGPPTTHPQFVGCLKCHDDDVE